MALYLLNFPFAVKTLADPLSCLGGEEASKMIWRQKYLLFLLLLTLDMLLYSFVLLSSSDSGLFIHLLNTELQ